MKELATSPDRGCFGIKRFEERLKEDPSDQHAIDMIKFEKDWYERAKEQEQDPEWQKDNLEYDLRTCESMIAKCRARQYYAQNLYAAMCNNGFVKNDVWPILKNQKWGCSWRYAGGIVAHMCGTGDYIDWYCSGLRTDGYQDDLDTVGHDEHVSEGTITDEVREDIEQLGWRVLDNEEDS